MTKEISANIFGKTQVIISKAHPNFSLDAPVYAVNWFNTKSLLLYNFYNLLASRSVTRVGGKPLIKGKITEVLKESEKNKRDVLLIVNYPQPKTFLSMMGSLYFQLVSILRVAAVANFTFGFTQPTYKADVVPNISLPKHYLVHHFKGADVSKALAHEAKLAGVDLIYAGALSARVSSKIGSSPNSFVPCFIDGLVVMQSEDKELLSKLAISDHYQDISKNSESEFIAFFDRLL